VIFFFFLSPPSAGELQYKGDLRPPAVGEKSMNVLPSMNKGASYGIRKGSIEHWPISVLSPCTSMIQYSTVTSLQGVRGGIDRMLAGDLRPYR